MKGLTTVALQGKTIQHPNFHVAPTADSQTLEVLSAGIELQLIGLEKDYFRVVLPDGRQGFVHKDLVVIEGATVPNPAVGGSPTSVVRGRTIQHPNCHAGPSQDSPTLFVLDPGVELELLGLENDYWHVKLADGREGFVHTDLVIAAQGGDGPQTPAGTLVVSIGNPFGEAVFVTASSLNGHHTPFGGNAACDLDTAGPSRGTPVRLKISCTEGARVRGRVDLIGMACRSGRLEDGGRWLRLTIEKDEQGQWLSTGHQVNFAHLDPINDALRVGAIVEDGFELGRLGPADPAGFAPVGGAAAGCSHPAGSPMLDEYHSSCAFHAHTHVEGSGSPWVNQEGVVCGITDAIMRFVL